MASLAVRSSAMAQQCMNTSNPHTIHEQLLSVAGLAVESAQAAPTHTNLPTVSSVTRGVIAVTAHIVAQLASWALPRLPCVTSTMPTSISDVRTTNARYAGTDAVAHEISRGIRMRSTARRDISASSAKHRGSRGCFLGVQTWLVIFESVALC